MTSSRVTRRLSSETDFVELPRQMQRQRSSPAGVLTTFLLGLILVTGPIVLGGARLWIELPILVGAALLFLVQGFRLLRRPVIGELRQLDAIDLSVLLFTLYAVVRWLTSPTEYFSRIEALEVIAYAGIFLTCRYGLQRRAYGLVILWLLIALGVGETLYGYYLSEHLDFFLYGPTESWQLHYAPRWLGTYGCPNHYSLLLVLAISASLSLGCFSKLSWPLRIVLFYLAGVMMLGVMFSISRGSWIALVAAIFALVIFGLRHGSVRWWVPIMAALLLVAGLIGGFSLSPTVRDRVGDLVSMIQTGKLNTYCRVELAWDALRIAHDAPIFGTGPATFIFIHPRYQSSTFGYKAMLTHDDYLNCLCDYGLVGFALAMFFFFAVTLRYFSNLKSDHRWQDRALVAAGFAAWAALAVHSLFDFNLHIPANAAIFFALTGLAMGRLKVEEVYSHWSTISLLPLRRAVGVVVILFSLLYGAEAGRSALADIIYEQAFSQAGEVPTIESILPLNDSLAYDRGNAQALLFLGDLYRYRASRQKEMEGRIAEGQKALDAYEAALAANPLDASIPARMGLTFDVLRRYPEAFFCYQTAVTAEPYNGQFWYVLGNHYWRRGMVDKAEEAYLRGANCPHGEGENITAESELRHLPGREGRPLPLPDANPLAPEPPPPEQPTTP